MPVLPADAAQCSMVRDSCAANQSTPDGELGTNAQSQQQNSIDVDKSSCFTQFRPLAHLAVPAFNGCNSSCEQTPKELNIPRLGRKEHAGLLDVGAFATWRLLQTMCTIVTGISHSRESPVSRSQRPNNPRNKTPQNGTGSN